MKKYHINDEGNPGVCRAKIKCRFGDLESNHYATPAEARIAYEKTQSSVAASPTSLIFTEKETKEQDQKAKEIVGLLSENGVFDLPEEQGTWWEKDAHGEDVLIYESVNLGNYKLLASGAVINAYLDEKTNTVYKVPHFEGVGENWSEDVSELLCGNFASEEKAFSKIDFEGLAKENISYVATRYFTVETNAGPIPVVTQRFLSNSEYEPVDLPGREQNRLTSYGVWDLNMGNVRRHKKTGHAVLLDCVPPWGAE